MPRSGWPPARSTPSSATSTGTSGASLAALAEAEPGGADLAVFPELTVTGYPPEDLLGRPAFVADNLAAFAADRRRHRRLRRVVGYVDTDPAGRLLNAAALCAGGRVLGRYVKRLLPNYGVFDEQRWFAPGEGPAARFVVAGVPVGITICEDMWFAGGPMADQASPVPACWSTSTPRRTRGAGARSAWPSWPSGWPRRAAPSSTSTRSAARTSWSSTGRPWWWRPTGRWWPSAAPVRRGGAGGRPRRRPTRRPAPAAGPWW